MPTVDRLEAVVQGRHEYAKGWKKRTGGKVVGYFCPYVPEEVIYAAGALPVRILGSHEPQDITEPYIFSNWCPFCRDCLAQGLQGRYDYLDGVVYAHCCMHLRQTFENWRRHIPLEFNHEVYVPPQLLGTYAKECLVGSLQHFQKSLEGWLGRAIGRDDLWRAVAVYNADRERLLRLYEGRRAPVPPVSGAQAMIAVLSSMLMDKQEHSRLMDEWLARLSPGGGADHRARLMIVGSENDDVEFLRFVESLGSVVVMDDLCTGAKYFWNQVEPEPDPISAIAQRYIDRPPCPQKDMGAQRRRLPLIQQVARDYGVQGALLIQQKFCTPHEWDFPPVRSALEGMGIPTLTLEFDVTVPVGQFRTRIEAFLEMLEVGAL